MRSGLLTLADLLRWAGLTEGVNNLWLKGDKVALKRVVSRTLCSPWDFEAQMMVRKCRYPDIEYGYCENKPIHPQIPRFCFVLNGIFNAILGIGNFSASVVSQFFKDSSHWGGTST